MAVAAKVGVDAQRRRRKQWTNLEGSRGLDGRRQRPVEWQRRRSGNRRGGSWETEREGDDKVGFF